MRNAGDGVSRRSSRQRGAADPEPPSPHDDAASLFTPAYRASQAVTGSGAANTGYGRSASDAPGAGHSWTDSPAGGSGTAPERPGYLTARGGHSDQVWPDDDVRSAYTWASDDVSLWPGEKVVTNAVRGFPPAPGEPLPVYPPGPFAAWNRGQPGQGDARDLQDTQRRAGSSQLVSARITPDEFDTNHSLPAIKDPIPGRENLASGGRDQGRRSAAAAIQGPVRDRRAEQDTLAPPS